MGKAVQLHRSGRHKSQFVGQIAKTLTQQPCRQGAFAGPGKSRQQYATALPGQRRGVEEQSSPAVDVDMNKGK